MTLRIEKSSDGNITTIRLIGRVQAEHLDELNTQIQNSKPPVALDLSEVSLIDVDVVRFLEPAKRRASSLPVARPAYATGSPWSLNAKTNFGDSLNLCMPRFQQTLKSKPFLQTTESTIQRLARGIAIAITQWQNS